MPRAHTHFRPLLVQPFQKPASNVFPGKSYIVGWSILEKDWIHCHWVLWWIYEPSTRLGTFYEVNASVVGSDLVGPKVGSGNDSLAMWSGLKFLLDHLGLKASTVKNQGSLRNIVESWTLICRAVLRSLVISGFFSPKRCKCHHAGTLYNFGGFLMQGSVLFSWISPISRLINLHSLVCSDKLLKRTLVRVPSFIQPGNISLPFF